MIQKNREMLKMKVEKIIGRRNQGISGKNKIKIREEGNEKDMWR